MDLIGWTYTTITILFVLVLGALYFAFSARFEDHDEEAEKELNNIWNAPTTVEMQSADLRNVDEATESEVKAVAAKVETIKRHRGRPRKATA